ncbi:Uncharacterised protein [Klebsiella pneumoniae]|nr:Uncharacterised protein [Klebsiella pneumoniae]VGQ06470.1 hypothetical protein SB5387_04608 [Klebsiella variicola]VGQ12167.1 hypothetical protein SB5610_04629 [Klebsiella variicola]
MARLAKLTRNLLIVIPAVVTIALLLLLFQQGFGVFNLSAKFFRTGAEQHPPQFFYLCPQMLYFAFFVLDFLFSPGQRRTQERPSLCNEAELTVFLAKRVFQRGDRGEIVLTQDPIYNAAMLLLQHCQWVKASCFWLTPVQLIEEHGEL